MKDPAVQFVCQPSWALKPDDWEWQRADGQRQGIGRNWRHSPGMFNLLWLSMDLGTPPLEYDSRDNALSMILIMHSEEARVQGRPLIEMASLTPLPKFMEMLAPQVSLNPAERAYPLLKLLAVRRLQHAHP